MGKYPFTLGQYFVDSCIQDKKKSFIRSVNGENFTYEDALLRVARSVQRFDEAGIQKGDHVVCYWEETIPAIFFTLACAIVGAVPIPLSPIFSVRYLKNLIKQSGARAVFTTLDRLDQLKAGGLEAICYADSTFSSPNHAEWSVEKTPNILFDSAVESLRCRAACSKPEDIFMVQTTSGSTGMPKLVVRTHLAPLRYARYVGAELRHENGERPSFLMVAALTHALGFHMFTTALSMGAELLIPNQIDARASLEEVRDLNPTVLPMTPRVLRSFFLQYSRNLSVKKSDQPIFGKKANYILVAGGPPDPEIFRTIQKQGVNVIEFYGSTEASLIALTQKGNWKPGCPGKKIPDVELKVAEDGELLVRSPGLMRGYYNDENLTREAYTADGFFHTGDMGTVDGDGYVRILGRKRDIFNTPEGSNIYPERVENLIETLPWVRQVILVGDRMPYTSALISVRPEKLKNSSSAKTVDGYLDVQHFAELYENGGHDLKQLNSQLERVDQVVRFALFQDSFDSEAYTPLQNGKIRRDRKKAHDTYQKRIEYLYSPSRQLDASFVPGVDRRLRPRTDLKAHLVWALQERQGLLSSESKEKVQQIFQNICSAINVEILTGKLASDHVHLFIAYPSDVTIKEIIQKIKSKSTPKLIRLFPQLKNIGLKSPLGKQGYFAVSSESITDEVIQNYVCAQERQTGEWRECRKFLKEATYEN